jgi:hypothetical protein
VRAEGEHGHIRRYSSPNGCQGWFAGLQIGYQQVDAGRQGPGVLHADVHDTPLVTQLPQGVAEPVGKEKVIHHDMDDCQKRAPPDVRTFLDYTTNGGHSEFPPGQRFMVS